MRRESSTLIYISRMQICMKSRLILVQIFTKHSFDVKAYTTNTHDPLFFLRIPLLPTRRRCIAAERGKRLEFNRKCIQAYVYLNTVVRTSKR